MMTSARNFTTLLAAPVLLYPLVAIFAPKGIVILLVLFALPFFAVGPVRAGLFRAAPRRVLLLLGLIAVWALITVWWSPRPMGSLTLWLRVAAIGLCGLVFMAAAGRVGAQGRRTLDNAFTLSGWLFVALFAFEIFSGGILSRLSVSLWDVVKGTNSEPPRRSLLLLEASAALAVFAWPCLAAMVRRLGVAAAVLYAAAVGVMLIFQNMEASLVAFAMGAAAYGAVYGRRRWGAAGVIAALVVINIAVVVTAFNLYSDTPRAGLAEMLSGGAKERLHIIDFVYNKIEQKTLFGWGFDSSRAVGQGSLGGFGTNKAIPLHPHNVWAQTWLELGLVGFAAVAGLIITMFAETVSSGRGRGAAALMIAAMTSYLLVGNISYGMWQNWWLAVAWLNAAFMVASLAPVGTSD